jgi:rhamnulokinase
MGMWLLERCRIIWKKEGKKADYDNLLQQAMNSEPFKHTINPDHDSFMNPPDMPNVITEFCQNTDQPVPKNQGEFVRCIFESLAFKYRLVIDKINSMLPNKIEVLHVVGGGSRNKLLNQFIANALGIKVIAGPVEATAIGNILIQAIAKGRISNLEQGRVMVADSFSLDTFEPQDHTIWEEQYQKKKAIL